MACEKDADGQFEVDFELGDKNSDAVFYELSDGRQRVADAQVPANWTSEAVSERYRDMKEFAKGLEGSPELASGVVNSLWQLVHGQPLRGRVVDPISAPHNEALQRLEEQLTGRSDRLAIQCGPYTGFDRCLACDAQGCPRDFASREFMGRQTGRYGRSHECCRRLRSSITPSSFFALHLNGLTNSCEPSVRESTAPEEIHLHRLVKVAMLRRSRVENL